MSERWGELPEYGGDYEVSDLGHIWSNKLWRGTRGRMLTPHADAYGYYRVNLYRDGRVRFRLVHQLVLETFVGPCPPGHEGCHGPGGPQDNRLVNLEWGDRVKNIADRVRDKVWVHGEMSPNAKLSWASVAEIRQRLAAGERQSVLAREFGISPATMHGVAHGKSWRP